MGEIIKIETNVGIIECEHKFLEGTKYHALRDTKTNKIFIAEKEHECINLVKEEYNKKVSD